MRMGEIQALSISNIHERYVSEKYSWSPKYGLVPPKGNSVRDNPIPYKTVKYLNKLMDITPYKGPDDLIFWGADRFIPIRNEIILNNLYSALEGIGISKEARKERNITFHSWRHFYNTVMRGKVPDSKLSENTLKAI